MSNIEDAYDAVPTFHPVWERREQAWFPGNEAASLLIAAEHVWSDILRLVGLRSGCSDRYNRKLLLKYIVVELCSMKDVMDALRSEVMRASVYADNEEPLYRGVSKSDHETAKGLWKTYSRAKAVVEKEIVQFRNEIGAHRELTDWRVWANLWDGLEKSRILEFMQSIPPAFNHAKDLNIYEWNRRTEDGAIEILAGPIGPIATAETSAMVGD